MYRYRGAFCNYQRAPAEDWQISSPPSRWLGALSLSAGTAPAQGMQTTRRSPSGPAERSDGGEQQRVRTVHSVAMHVAHLLHDGHHVANGDGVATPTHVKLTSDGEPVGPVLVKALPT